MNKFSRCLYIICLLFTVVSCSRQSNHHAQGYIEGRYTYLATSVSGVLNQLNVTRGQRVTKGQLLYELEKEPESDAYAAADQELKEAIAQRNAVSANLALARLTYERYKKLVPKNAIQQSSLDSAKATFNATLAELSQLNATISRQQAALAEASWRLSQKTGYAPIDGIVFDTYYRLGEYTKANQAILSLLAPQDIKAIFYISQMDLGRIKLRDKVSVQCDGCVKAYAGHISFISPSAEYTPPVIYSNETNEKLIYRIEAEFKPQDAIHLHPGQPVNVVMTW